MKKTGSFLILALALGGPAWAQESLAGVQAQLDRIQTELQELRGAIEAQTVLFNQLEQKSDRNYRDLEMRLLTSEEKVKLFQEVLNQSLSKLSPAVAQQYQKFQAALDLVKTHEYAKALLAFQQLIQQYPKSPHKPEALFWIAECRYATGDYAQAIKDYQKFVQAYPKSEKAPQATLKQGDGFLRLNMPNEAKVFFKKVATDYPNSEQAAEAKGKLSTLDRKESEGLTPGPTAPTPLPPAPQPAAPTNPEVKISPEDPSEF